jgi:hypothetical protein
LFRIHVASLFVWFSFLDVDAGVKRNDEQPMLVDPVVQDRPTPGVRGVHKTASDASQQLCKAGESLARRTARVHNVMIARNDKKIPEWPWIAEYGRRSKAAKEQFGIPELFGVTRFGKVARDADSHGALRIWLGEVFRQFFQEGRIPIAHGDVTGGGGRRIKAMMLPEM